MTKKKPSPQNRIWEKERRERLNKTFEDLHRLLPDHEPSSTLTKVEILQQAIELINKLQKKVKDLVQECNDPLKEQLQEHEKRLKRMLERNEELAELLRKAKITVPPCKYTIAEEERQQRSEEKENGNRAKKVAVKRRRSGAAAPKKPPVISKKPPPTCLSSTMGSEALALSSVKCVSTGEAVPVSSSCPDGAQLVSSSTALKHINGISIGPGHGVNVTPALLSTPIMTTSVLISNNGNLLQMPLVAPPSSLLIVGSEDVRAKLNLKNRPTGASGKGKTKRGKFTIKSIDLIPGRIVNGKIPIPPLRRSTHESMTKGSKMPKLKRKKSMDKGKKARKSPVESTGTKTGGETPDSAVIEQATLQVVASGSVEQVQCKAIQHEPQDERREFSTHGAVETQQAPPSLLPVVDKNIRSEQDKMDVTPSNDITSQAAQLDINLNPADLPEDIFALHLQVPGDSSTHHGHHDDGSLSPTAAYLMNFPLVAGGGKAAGNHIEAGDGDECDDGTTVAELQTAKKDSSGLESVHASGAAEIGGSLLLDNFSSFFNYGQLDAVAGNGPSGGPDGTNLQSLGGSSTTHVATVAPATVTATPSTRESGFTNYTTMYQSIDNMLDHRPVAPNRTTQMSVAPSRIPVSSESDYGATVAFTFTLTSGTTTAPTTAQPGTIGTNHFYGPACGALNPVKPPADDFSSPLKPSIEFTFSLTSTTGSQPRTVQSQYTNSAILATTMTTPSYDTYGYYHKTVPKSSSYCASFGVLDPLLATEKPATSFTFSLTSSTKTEPSYTQSSLATVPTHTSQVYETTPKLATKHQPVVAVECFPAKAAAPKVEKITGHRGGAEGGHGASMGDASHVEPSNGSQQQQHPPAQVQQQTQVHSSYNTNSSQSRYDVSWMAAGTHNDTSATVSNHHHHNHHVQQQQHHQQQQHQQQQQQPYELPSAQMIPSLEFPVPTGGYSSSFKSDIFFAHPPGEENNLTWSSPSKLANILNDSSSPYFPPVTLPNLNGDLALNTSVTGSGAAGALGVTSSATTGVSGSVSAVGSCKLGTSNVKKGHTHATVAGGPGQGSDGTQGASSFLSVSQLVNQPTKAYHSQTNAGTHGSVPCQQKPLNNNYSAEALIGNTYNSNSVSLSAVGHDGATGRKDKLFDYGCTIMDGGAFGSSSVPSGSASALSFNFDTYGATPGAADYNKGYNFAASTQQNAYVPPPFVDGGYAGSGNCPGSASASGTTGLPYYGKTSSQGYYQQVGPGVMGSSASSSSAANYSHPTPSVAGTVAQDFSPYYLPKFGEKPAATKQSYPGTSHGSSGSELPAGKARKPHKPTGIGPTAVDYAPPVAVCTSTIGGSSSTASSYSYASLSNTTTAVPTAGTALPDAEPHSYPNYHHHQQHQLQQQHQQQHQPSQRSQNHQQYGTSEVSSSAPSHKPSSAGSYNYRQHSSSTSVGFGSSVKSGKPTQQHERTPHHDPQTHHSPYPTALGGGSQAHPAHLGFASSFNAPPPPPPQPPPSSYGTHLLPQPDLTGHGSQETASYVASASSNSNHPHHRQQHQQQQHHQSHPVHPHQQHLHHVPHQQQTLSGTASSGAMPSHMGSGGNSHGGSCGTITNFNLSTICPEINDKTGRSSDAAMVASIMTHW